ncbi:hypothetical protein [Spirillospora sp. CA-294931]|uniref:hypothetical protein n=1 Tax=Spirillospora sp. CA-294931 TaxID=3240042 RepID=UPI003D91709D
MWLRGHRRSRVGRWIVAAAGLGVLGVAAAGVGDPYRQTREFRQVVACEKEGGGCFVKEAATITGRTTYKTTSTTTDAEGNTTTTTTTHYKVSWRRADGSADSSDVSSGFYRKATRGQPATLRLWRGEVVGVEVTGADEWFLPKASGALAFWLYLAHAGLGLLLWGLLFGWWDGFFSLTFRVFAWAFLGVVPVAMATHAMAYGWPAAVNLVVAAVVCLFFMGIAGAMLVESLDGL